MFRVAGIGGVGRRRVSVASTAMLLLVAVFGLLSFGSFEAVAGDGELCDRSLAAPDLGIPACTRLLEQSRDGPNAASQLNNRGVAKVSRGDYLDAVADFTSALDRNPNFVDAYRNRGIAWQMASEFDKAIADFTRAIKINPKVESLYNARGSALFSKEEYGSAIDDFNRAIALNKKFAPAYLNRGLAYQFRRKLDNATQDFTHYIELVPNDIRGLTNRAAARMDKADFDGAIADFTQAIARDGSSWMAFSGRGEALRLKGDYERSLADHDKAIALDANPDAYVNRALLHRSRGEFDAALADCNEAILLNPKHALAYANRGAISAEMHDTKSALADLDKAVSLNPNSPLPLTFRGNALREAGRTSEALADFDRALRALPDFVAGYTGRGLTYERKSDADAARADFSKALALPTAIDYALAKPAQDLARKRLALLDEDRATLAFRTAQASADSESIRRNEAEKIAAAASAERKKYEAEAAARADAEKVARANFEAKVKAEAKAEIAQRTKAEQERLEAEMRMKDAAEARQRAEFEARARQRAETEAKSEFEARLKAEVDARVKAQVEAQAKIIAEANARIQPTKSFPKPTERRIALVIGNSAYRDVPQLDNPKPDAEVVAKVLREIGFQLVTVELDLTREQFVAAIRKFEDEVERADWAMIYYAGHGMEANGRNYMVPIDARLKSDRDIPDETVSLDRILTATERARKLRLVVLDACRDNPFASKMRKSAGSRVSAGLARIEPEGGTLVSYAARDGKLALDGQNGHSPFTSAFVQTITKPGLEVNMMFRTVRDIVFAQTKKIQEPITWGSLSGESFYFVDN